MKRGLVFSVLSFSISCIFLGGFHPDVLRTFAGAIAIQSRDDLTEDNRFSDLD